MFRGVPTFRRGIAVPASDLHALAVDPAIGGDSLLDDDLLSVWLRACLALDWRGVRHEWTAPAGRSCSTRPLLCCTPSLQAFQPGTGASVSQLATGTRLGGSAGVGPGDLGPGRCRRAGCGRRAGRESHRPAGRHLRQPVIKPSVSPWRQRLCRAAPARSRRSDTAQERSALPRPTPAPATRRRPAQRNTSYPPN